MKLNKTIIGLAIVAGAPFVLATEPAPVIDVSSAPVGGVAEQLSSLERKLDARNRAQVNIQRQLDELQNEVNELRGVTELHSHQLGQVLERQRELYQELDRRVSEALKSSSPQVPAILAAPSGQNQGTTNYSTDLTENELYNRAVNMVLKDKQYDQAIPAFRRFNEKYPNSSYSANAHYWLGQLLFNKGTLVEAASEFSLVVEQYPDSNKRADAMLKLGMVAQKQGQKEKAIETYQKLLNEYPSSTAAQLAQPRLASLQP